MFGPSVNQASHGLGTTDEEDEAVQVAQAVLASTAARTLAPIRAQQLLAQGHRYLDGDGDGEACESLR